MNQQSLIAAYGLNANRGDDPEAPPGITQEDIRAKLPNHADAIFEYLDGSTQSLNGYYLHDIERALDAIEQGTMFETAMFLE